MEWLDGILGTCLILSHFEKLLSEMVVPIYSLIVNAFNYLLLHTLFNARYGQT